MQILVIGNKKRHAQAGFSLIEVLIVLVIVSITMGLMSLSLPNLNERHWRDLHHRLIVSLNQAKDEATLSGAAIHFQVNEQGWRFTTQDAKNNEYLLGDVLAPYLWEKKTTVEGVQDFYLEDVQKNQTIAFKIIQGDYFVTIQSRPDGYFAIQ